jgi:hypothetical protein
VSAHLSPAWHADVAAALGKVAPVPGGFTGRVRWTVTKAPGGDATYTWTWRDGAVVDVAEGGADDVEVDLTVAYADAGPLARAEVSPAVAYMRGRLKAAGHSGLVLSFLERTNDPDVAAALAEVGTRTETAATAD